MKDHFSAYIKGFKIHFRKAKNSPYWRANLDRFGKGRRSTGKRNPSDAVEKITEWFEKENPKPIKSEESTLAGLCRNYLQYIKQNCADSTYKRTDVVLNRLFLVFVGEREVTADILRDFVTWRLETVSKVSVNRDLSTIRAMYNLAIAEKRISYSPMIRNLKEKKRLPKPYSQEQIDIILAASPPLWRLIWLVFLNVGFRRADARLKWSDVREKIHIVDTKEGKERTVPISDELRWVLPKLKVEIGKIRRFKNGCDYVIPYSKSMLTNKFKKIVTDCGVDGNLHRLRHSFASHALGLADLKTVSEWMGHADIRTTDLYMKSLNSQKDKAIKGLSFSNLHTYLHTTL